MKSTWNNWWAIAALVLSCAVCSSGYAQIEGFPEKPASADSAQWRDLQLAVSKALGTPIKLTGDRSTFRADGEALDAFGFSVALDGDTALVGAYLDDIGPSMDQGSVYVFVRETAGWTLRQKLAPADGASADHFGHALAIQGDTALIGSPNRVASGQSGSGAVYVLTRVGGIWNQRQELISPTPSPGDNFGISVALDGDTALVGARYDDLPTTAFAGAAYIFVRNGETWTVHQRLAPSDTASFDNFGNTVALQGSNALVGAPQKRVGENNGQGAVYVFGRQGGTWIERQKLFAPDGEAEDAFGNALALDGDRALVAAYKDDVQNNTISDGGSVHVFQLAGGLWFAEQQLFDVGTPITQRNFGISVALQGGVALVGVPRAFDGSFNHGRAQVFQRGAGGWARQQVIAASQGTTNALFGSAVALDEGTALIGAPGDRIGGNLAQGSLSVFTQSGGSFSEQQSLTAGVGGGDNRFGYAVDVDGNTAIVGAYGHDIGSNDGQGAAYLFVRNGPRWVLQQKLWASDGNDYEGFGYSVALDGDTALVGAYQGRVEGTGSNTTWQGAAYVFQRAGQAWHVQQKLLAADRVGGDMFGVAVAVEGDTALIGAHEVDSPGAQEHGAAYIFARNGVTWAQQQKLTAADRTTGARFGNAVALAGDSALIGASRHDDQGAAYVFARQPGGWIQQQKLLASDGSTFARFGNSVSLEGDYALVGAPGADGTRGAAYVFERAGAAWTQQRKLTAVDADSGGFGTSVALSGASALVGAPLNFNIQPRKGAAYLFVRTGATWDGVSKIVAVDGAREHFFGWAVALAGDTALIGAFGHTSELPYASVDEGAAYLFDGEASQLPASNNLFDARRDGHGIDFVWVRDNLYALTFYTYGANGEPEWYQALGNVVNGVFVPFTDANGRSLIRYRYTAGNTPPQVPVSAQSGTVGLDFNNPASQAPCNDGRPSANAVAVMTFTLGADQNVRWCMEPIVAADARPAGNYSGLWFAGSADDGWGWSILNFTAGATVSTYGLLFYYDALGNPVWSYSLHSGVSPNSATAIFHRRGYCRTCAVAPFVDAVAGSVTFGFTQPSESAAANNRVSYDSTPQNSVGGRFARSNTPFVLLTTPQ